MRAADTQALAADLLGAISGIRRIARRGVRLTWRDDPLPAAQSELLRLAAARPGISVADAARELRLAPNTVSTLVGRLTAAGLLGRARAASDGRSVRLTVTDKATRRIAGWRDLRAEITARAIDRLTAGDRKILAQAVPALTRLAAHLEAAHLEEDPGDDYRRTLLPPCGAQRPTMMWFRVRDGSGRRKYGGGAAAEPDADGGTACSATIARTGAPHGAAPPHSVTIASLRIHVQVVTSKTQVCIYRT